MPYYIYNIQYIKKIKTNRKKFFCYSEKTLISRKIKCVNFFFQVLVWAAVFISIFIPLRLTLRLHEDIFISQNLLTWPRATFGMTLDIKIPNVIFSNLVLSRSPLPQMTRNAIFFFFMCWLPAMKLINLNLYGGRGLNIPEPVTKRRSGPTPPPGRLGTQQHSRTALHPPQH